MRRARRAAVPLPLAQNVMPLYALALYGWLCIDSGIVGRVVEIEADAAELVAAARRVHGVARAVGAAGLGDGRTVANRGLLIAAVLIVERVPGPLAAVRHDDAAVAVVEVVDHVRDGAGAAGARAVAGAAGGRLRCRPRPVVDPAVPEPAEPLSLPRARRARVAAGVTRCRCLPIRWCCRFPFRRCPSIRFPPTLSSCRLSDGRLRRASATDLQQATRRKACSTYFTF